MSKVTLGVIAVVVLAFPVTILTFAYAGPSTVLLILFGGLAIGISMKVAMDQQSAEIRKLEARVEQLESEVGTSESDEGEVDYQ